MWPGCRACSFCSGWCGFVAGFAAVFGPRVMGVQDVSRVCGGCGGIEAGGDRAPYPQTQPHGGRVSSGSAPGPQLGVSWAFENKLIWITQYGRFFRPVRSVCQIYGLLGGRTQGGWISSGDLLFTLSVRQECSGRPEESRVGFWKQKLFLCLNCMVLWWLREVQKELDSVRTREGRSSRWAQPEARWATLVLATPAPRSLQARSVSSRWICQKGAWALGGISPWVEHSVTSCRRTSADFFLWVSVLMSCSWEILQDWASWGEDQGPFSKAGVLSEARRSLMWRCWHFGQDPSMVVVVVLLLLPVHGSMLSSAPPSTHCSGQSDMSPDFATSLYPQRAAPSAPFYGLRGVKVTRETDMVAVLRAHQRLQCGPPGAPCGPCHSSPTGLPSVLMDPWKAVALRWGSSECCGQQSMPLTLMVQWFLAALNSNVIPLLRLKGHVFFFSVPFPFPPFFFPFLMQYTEREYPILFSSFSQQFYFYFNFKISWFFGVS